MKLKTFSIIGGIAVAGLVSASSVSSASAVTLTKSYTDSFTSTTAPFSKTLSFPTFSLTGLIGVEFVTTLTTQATLQIVNLDSVSHTFTNGQAVVPLTVTAPTTGFTANAIATIAGGTVAPFPPKVSFASSPDTTTTNSFVPSSQFSSYETPPASASYTVNVAAGSGTYGGTETGGAGDLFFGGNASVSGTIEVIYTYTAVPEPLTILGGLTALGLGMGLKRQLKSKKRNA